MFRNMQELDQVESASRLVEESILNLVFSLLNIFSNNSVGSLAQGHPGHKVWWTEGYNITEHKKESIAIFLKLIWLVLQRSM